MKYFIHILEEQILYSTRAPNTLKSEGEMTSLSCADKREVVRVQGEVKIFL
jgi:hypothetical protein